MRYILLNKDTPLLAFDLKGTLVDSVEMIGQTHQLPEILKTGKEAALQHWLSTRGIDTTRTNARLLLKELRLKSDRVSAVVYNRGLNMTDCYWIKDTRKDETIKFAEVSLYRKENIRSISALSISGRAVEVPTIRNHEMTNIGSFNKAWIREGDKWWLYKGGSVYNNYAELFTYYLGELLGFNMAVYKFSKEHALEDREALVASLNFTDESYMLEHYDSFRYQFEEVELEDDEIIWKNMQSIGLGEAYKQMLILDALVANTDRHEFNFGVLKEVDTGKVVGFAPYFDHNLSLGSHLGTPERIGMGQYKLCQSIVGEEAMEEVLDQLQLSEIKAIDQKVRDLLKTEKDFTFVVEYFKKILNKDL